MDNERKAELHLRLDGDVRDRIKTAVGEGCISDFLVGLFLDWEKSHQPKEGWPEIYAKLPQSLQSHFDARENVLLFGSGRGDIEGFEKVAQTARNIGQPFDVSDYKPEVASYIKSLETLSNEDLSKFTALRETHDKLKMQPEFDSRSYSGNPDEVVYRKITRRQLYDTFKDKRKTWTTQEIAGELNINYMKAYVNIVPWMKSHGWRVK